MKHPVYQTVAYCSFMLNVWWQWCGEFFSDLFIYVSVKGLLKSGNIFGELEHRRCLPWTRASHAHLNQRY